jgi:maltodextrin utilization protein YvdJ
MNLIYFLLLAGISMSFKFRTQKFPRFKEVLVMYLYAASIPSVFALFLTFVTKSYAFTPLVMNFATPIILYLIYKKKISKS